MIIIIIIIIIVFLLCCSVNKFAEECKEKHSPANLLALDLKAGATINVSALLYLMMSNRNGNCKFIAMAPTKAKPAPAD